MAVERILTEWRRPGCDGRCHLERVIRPGLLGSMALEVHDPDAHEAYGERMERIRATPAGRVETGPLAFDFDRLEARVDGQLVYLTPTETRLLLALVRRIDRLSENRYLIEAALGREFLLDDWRASLHILRVAICRLRVKLCRAGDLIGTRYNTGYLLQMVTPGAPVPRRRRYSSGGRRIAGWASHYEQCICCGQTDRPYRAYGRCRRCYRALGHGVHYGPCAAPAAHTTTETENAS